MKFGVSQGFSPLSGALEILRAAEDAGFDQYWLFDSHIIWLEAYSSLGWLIAQSRNDRMQFGTCVTNPVTRDSAVVASAFATLNQVTGGRMICGIGRGDSSVRVRKRKPANLADVEHAIELIRTVGSGKPMEDEEGAKVHMEWAEHRVPLYVAAYGPKALRLAGRVGDGVIFQVADPFFIEWGMQFVREGAEEAGRNPEDIVIHCAAATYISATIATTPASKCAGSRHSSRTTSRTSSGTTTPTQCPTISPSMSSRVRTTTTTSTRSEAPPTALMYPMKSATSSP